LQALKAHFACASACVLAFGLLIGSAKPAVSDSPGKILNVCPLSGGGPGKGDAFRILYRSTGLQGEKVDVSGAIFIPPGSAPKAGRNVIAWAHPTSGVVRACAPSLMPDVSNMIWGLPNEPHAGRPMSSKVAQLMNGGTAGIFIFTKDELFFRQEPKGETTETWRPSENVIYELGAAGILWEKKIIILREDGVNFPSDFSDLGYITFKEGDISAKAMEIMKQLITFKLLILQAA
jgi:hypothetical protein